MNRCVVCHCHAEKLLCRGCQQLIQAPAAGCHVCAKPLTEINQPVDNRLCADCRKERPAFDGIACAGVYQPPGSEWVIALKFSGQLHWARAMAELMSPVITDWPLGWPLLAMPLHRKRLQKRGFNQAHEITRLMAQASGRRVLSDCLERSQYTAMQATLPEKKRRDNVRHAFTVNGSVLPEALILVDDVLTTGQTLSSAAATLKKAGVKHVWGAVFLRSAG